MSQRQQRLIPRKDQAFASKAGAFARLVGEEPERYGLSREDAEAMRAAAEGFAAALRRSQAPKTRTPIATREKDNARAEAERLFKRCVERIRAGDRLDVNLRVILGVGETAETRRARTVPMEPPRLRFARALHEGSSATSMHELTFCALAEMVRGPKPDGAVRIELFCDVFPPGEPVPQSPGENYGGRPWYLRSYSRSPIRIVPPMAREPMMVVYWGRWADAVGNVGPFCATVVSRVEGWTGTMLSCASFASKASDGGRGPKVIEQDPSAPPTPAPREPRYSVAVRDAQYEYLNPPLVDARPPEPKQIEGPTGEAAEAA